jgi:hypothetical protein
VVETNRYDFTPDGRTVFAVPPLPRGCSVYLFGLLKVRESSAYDVKAVKLLKNDRVVRRFSLNEIDRLPRDEAGSFVIAIKN